MNTQEIFDKVVTHLLTQNEKSLGYDGLCKYRGNNGLMCAVGCLITDKDYRLEIEGLSASHCTVLNSLGYSDPILEDLQIIHDNTLVSDWPQRLYQLALQTGLEVPQILLERLQEYK